eukprot:5826748-Amphidinium_carterae.1
MARSMVNVNSSLADHPCDWTHSKHMHPASYKDVCLRQVHAVYVSVAVSTAGPWRLSANCFC